MMLNDAEIYEMKINEVFRSSSCFGRSTSKRPHTSPCGPFSGLKARAVSPAVLDGTADNAPKARCRSGFRVLNSPRASS